MTPSRQGRAFLVSLVVHGVILGLVTSLETETPSAPAELPLVEDAAPPVFLPSTEAIRELTREQRRPAPPPTSVPPPSPAAVLPTPDPARDRISVGPRSDERSERLVLRRDEDLTAPEGDPARSHRHRDDPEPEATPSAAPSVPSPSPLAAGSASPEPGTLAEDRLRAGNAARPGQALPLGGQDGRRGTRGGPPRPGSAPGAGSLAESLRNLDRHLGQGGAGMAGGRRMGPLFFDPEGADFTAWINHFKNEVYRNWRVPQTARLGFAGHVDLEFLVERNGEVVNLRILKSSGTSSLDRAAANAILGSLLLPLPPDYAPLRAPMQVTFFYGPEPQGS